MSQRNLLAKWSALSLICLSGVAGASGAPASVCATESALFSIQYLGGCGYEQGDSFTLSASGYVTKIRLWYDTGITSGNLNATLTKPDGSKSSQTTTKGGCYGSWCEGNLIINDVLPAGRYTVTTTNTASLCRNPSGDSTIIVYGCADAAGSASVATPVSETDLAGLMVSLPISSRPPRDFRMTDPLGLDGLSLLSADAALTAGAVRISNMLSDDQAVYADFQLATSPSVRFNLSKAGYGIPGALSGSGIPGLDTSGTQAFLQGPPLRLQLMPIGIGGAYYSAGFLFDGAPGFKLESTALIPSDDFVVTRGNGSFAVAKTVDDLIAEKTTLDMSLPSGADWEGAVLKCATKVIEQLNVGSVGAKALKMMGTNGPRIFQDMRTHLLMGHPGDATLVFSELAWKALADNAESKSEYVAVLQAISKNSAYGRALAAGAGTCGVDYKEALKVLLKGMADKAFPIGACLAGLGWQSGLQARSMLNDVLIKDYYDKWLIHGDDLIVYGAKRGSDGIIGHIAATLTGKNPYQITDADRALGREWISTTFPKWKAAQAATASQNLGPRLQALKTRFKSLSTAERSAVASYVGENPSEADVFWRYVELMQRTRARLAPYALYINSDDVDYYSEQAVLALVQNGSNGQKAWKQAIAKDMQAWDPNNFTAEPKVCSAPAAPVTPAVTTQVASGLVEWGPHHLQYAISGSGVALNPRIDKPGHLWDVYSYTGKLSSPGLITVSGTAIADNPTSSENFYYGISVTVTAGKNSQSFEYRAPVGEKLNKPFSVSVSVPEEATTASFSMVLTQKNPNYGDRGIVVDGSMNK